jgi:hypothetical protein
VFGNDLGDKIYTIFDRVFVKKNLANTHHKKY